MSPSCLPHLGAHTHTHTRTHARGLACPSPVCAMRLLCRLHMLGLHLTYARCTPCALDLPHPLVHVSRYTEKEGTKKLQAKQRERMQPKMGRMDIDYQVRITSRARS